MCFQSCKRKSFCKPVKSLFGYKRFSEARVRLVKRTELITSVLWSLWKREKSLKGKEIILSQFLCFSYVWVKYHGAWFSCLFMFVDWLLRSLGVMRTDSPRLKWRITSWKLMVPTSTLRIIWFPLSFRNLSLNPRTGFALSIVFSQALGLASCIINIFLISFTHRNDWLKLGY